jgi:hypothetical protein
MSNIQQYINTNKAEFLGIFNYNNNIFNNVLEYEFIEEDNTCQMLCYLHVFHLMISSTHILDDLVSDVLNSNNYVLPQSIINDKKLQSNKPNEQIKYYNMKDSDKNLFIQHILFNIYNFRKTHKLKFTINFINFLKHFNFCWQNDTIDDVLNKIVLFNTYYIYVNFDFEEINQYINEKIINSHIKTLVPTFLEKLELYKNYYNTLLLTLGKIDSNNKRKQKLKTNLLRNLSNSTTYNISSIIVHTSLDSRCGHYYILLRNHDNIYSKLDGSHNTVIDLLDKSIINSSIILVLTKKNRNTKLNDITTLDIINFDKKKKI